MTVSLLAALLLIAQPAPEEATEEPVAVEVEAQTDVQVQTPPLPPVPPVAHPPAHAHGNGGNGAAELQVAAEAEAEETAAPPQEEEICRRRLVPSERIGQRHRVATICKTREEWARGNRR